MSIVILMSHGSNMKRDIKVPGKNESFDMKMTGGYTEVIGTDGVGIGVEDIVNLFTVENCPAMKGKPKIFIFQCCR